MSESSAVISDTVDLDLGPAPAVPEWIKRTANEERRRDDIRRREQKLIADKAELVRLNARRLVDQLVATVTRDIETFQHEFPEDRRHDIALTLREPEGGFSIRSRAPHVLTLTVSLDLKGAKVVCHYQFKTEGTMPPREESHELMFVDETVGDLRIKLRSAQHGFESIDALSEFLLMPVFTGRPR